MQPLLFEILVLNYEFFLGIPLTNNTSGIITKQAIAHTSKVSLKAPILAC